MSTPEHAILDEVETSIDWVNGRTFAVQIDGHDLVQVSLSSDGTAEVTVWASTRPEAEAVATHTVRWDERAQQPTD